MAQKRLAVFFKYKMRYLRRWRLLEQWQCLVESSCRQQAFKIQTARVSTSQRERETVKGIDANNFQHRQMHQLENCCLFSYSQAMTMAKPRQFTKEWNHNLNICDGDGVQHTTTFIWKHTVNCHHDTNSIQKSQLILIINSRTEDNCSNPIHTQF